jgi:hypothetical protein
MRKVATIFACLWLGSGLTLVQAGAFSSRQATGVRSAQKETAIRNLTKVTVKFEIRRLVRDSQPASKELRPGGLDRFACDGPLDITFERKGKKVSYRLECGLPYAFRYDENNNLELYSGSHGLFGVDDLAPFVPTPMAVVEKMLELGQVDKDDLLFDLGCGDGRIVIAAAKNYGTRGVGIDLDPQRIEESQKAAKEAGVEALVEFRLQDATKADFRSATVVLLYLLPESNELLRPLLEEQLRPGTLVVTHNYSIPGWEQKEISYVTMQDGTGQDHTIFVYRR